MVATAFVCCVWRLGRVSELSCFKEPHYLTFAGQLLRIHYRGDSVQARTFFVMAEAKACVIYRCGKNLSVGANSFGGVCHQLEVMRLSRVSDKRRFLVLHGVLCELMALQ